jgi:hypothetical protein
MQRPFPVLLLLVKVIGQFGANGGRLMKHIFKILSSIRDLLNFFKLMNRKGILFLKKN